MAVSISLPPKLEEKIAARVASGEYADPSDVVREALRLFEKYEQIEATHRRLREAGEAEQENRETFDVRHFFGSSRATIH